MFIIGKAFQAAGILCIPVAVVQGILTGDLRTEFRMWIVSMGLFAIGWIFEKKLGRRD